MSDGKGCTMTAFHESFDARDWAKAFAETVRERPQIATDEGTLVGWFANAIMRGYDTARAKFEQPTIGATSPAAGAGGEASKTDLRPPFVARKRDVFIAGRLVDVRICKADSEYRAEAIAAALNRDDAVAALRGDRGTAARELRGAAQALLDLNDSGQLQEFGIYRDALEALRLALGAYQGSEGT